MPHPVVGVLNDPALAALRGGLDMAALRHEVVANNLANARTPGFRASDVTFAQQVLAVRDARSEPVSGASGAAGEAGLSSGTAGPEWVATASPRMDAPFNGVAFVDVHREVAHMTENSVRYLTMTQLAASRFRLLNDLVREGRR